MPENSTSALPRWDLSELFPSLHSQELSAAHESHFFTPFYNWPPTFGLLFGIGLFARYQDDPERFRQGYEDLLSSTGLGSAADLGMRSGIDVTSREFWDSSLDLIRARIDEFARLATDA